MRAAGAGILVLLALASVAATAQPAPVAFVDFRLMEGLTGGGSQEAILVADPARFDHVQAALLRNQVPHRAWPHLGMAAVAGDRADLGTLARVEGVEALWALETMEPMLDRSADYIGASIVWDTYGQTGAGVTVLVVDTGIDGTHPDVRYGRNLVENVVPTRQASGLIGGYAEGVVASDSSGHGTHVASTIAGLGLAAGPGTPDAGRYRGIAHGASIVGFAAGLSGPGDDNPSFDSTTVLEAYEYALANKDRLGIRIVSNSWGTDGAFTATSPVNLATRQLYLSGLVVTFAAGNEGAAGAGTLNKYCSAPWVLCVGAGDYLNQRASFSSIGTDPALSGRAYDHPDLLAPGVAIRAAKAGSDAGALVGGLLVPSTAATLYASKSGTSMATPHVAGAAALLLAENPDLSPDQVYDVLVGTATPTPGLELWEGGVGYLNALEAFRVARDLPGGRSAFLDGQVKYAGALVGDPAHARDPTSVGLHGVPTLTEQGAELPALAQDLVGTTQGLTLLVGSALLALAAFGVERGRPR